MVERTLGPVLAPLEISFFMLSGYNVINSEENDQQISPSPSPSRSINGTFSPC